jgi:hypothetical protein
MSPESDELTKEQLLNKLGSERKEALVAALAKRLNKEELVNLLGSRLKKEELAEVVDSAGQESESDEDADESDDDESGSSQRRGSRQSGSSQQNRRSRSGDRDDGDTSLDWNSELDWSPPPRPTPAPVLYVGGAPSMPGQRVRVDVSGLPMMGIFAGRGATAAGTITGVDAHKREVKVWLDAGFDGEKEIVVPPERVIPEG